jgi:hypothetical protein
MRVWLIIRSCSVSKEYFRRERVLCKKENLWEGEQIDFTQCISVLVVDTVRFAVSPDDMGMVNVDLSYSFHFAKTQMQHMPKYCKKLNTG